MLKFAFLALIPAALFAQTNLDFENPGAAGSMPSGWYGNSVVGSGFSFGLANQGCLVGARCAKAGGPASAQSDWYGVFAQTIGNPALYHGRGFRLRAAVRVSDPNTSVRFWVGDGGYTLNALGGTLTVTEWQYFEIEGSMPSPSSLNFGFIIRGSGTVWIDDVSFLALRTEAPEAARELTADGLANITAFARVYGYVRHFHPSDPSPRVSWISFANEGARAVEGAATPDELASRLRTLFASIAPAVQIFPTGAPPDLPPALKPQSAGSLQLVRWKHYGAGIGSGNVMYYSVRESAPAGGALPENFEDPAQPYEAEIGRGLSVRVPLTLYKDAQGTLPHSTYQLSDCCLWSADDRGSRLGGIIFAWNIAQHFYPYFDVVQTDWAAALTSALRSAATDSGSDNYFRTLSRMWAALKDGHGYVAGPQAFYGVAPLEWQWVENQLVVTQVNSEFSQAIVPGDRILAIDGVPAEDAIAAQRQLISGATPQYILHRTLSALARCGSSRSMSLEFKHYSSQGSRQTLNVACQNSANWSILPGEAVRQLEPGIMYVDINRVTASMWTDALPQLTSAQGIIFDLRGYPTSHYYLPFLSQTPLDTAQFLVPTPRNPERAGLTFTDVKWSLTPLEPYLRAKRVFLTDGRAISYAETVMGIVENYHLAEIVGSTTAGTNGNVNTIWLPGGFSLGFTGMKVLKHDGSQHHGVGIHPTIPASRTREGVAAGRDDVLDRGIQVLKGPQPGPAPLISAVVNAASGAGGAVAPGEIVSILGANLGPGAGALTSYDGSGYLGAYAGETRVFFDDIQAPMLYASSTQVNAIVPYQVAASTKVRVEYQLRSSEAAALAVAASAPGIFADRLSRQAVALNQNGAVNSSGQPAARGELITFYATGEGQTSPAGVTGRMPQAGKSPSPAGEVAVSFGGAPGEVIFAGVVQAGLLQLQARIPAAAPAGASVPVVLTIGGTSSPPNAAVAIK